MPIDERLPPAADLDDVLEAVAGANVSALGGLGDWSAVSIRGSGLRHVQVHLDGIPLNPDGADVVNLAELPLRAFERVEVWRGHAPPELGAAAIGGVVNLVTAADGAAPSFSGAYGSYGTGRMTASGGADLGAAGRAWAFGEVFTTRGDYRYFDDASTTYNLLDDHVRVRDNNDKTQSALTARWRLGDDRLRLTILDSFLVRDEGLPGPIGLPATEARFRTVRDLLAAQLEGGGQATRGSLRAWGQLRDETLADPEAEVGVGGGHTRGRHGTVGALAHGRAAWTPGLVPSLTAEGRHEAWRERDLVAGTDTAPKRRHVVSLTAAATARLLDERVTITSLARGTYVGNRDLGGGDGSTWGIAPETEPVTSIDPRLGALWRPHPTLAIKGNVGRYLRPPDLLELFGDHGAVRGNAALRPERGWQADVGARWVLPDHPVARGTLEVTVFDRRTTDLITWVQNAQKTFVAVNVGRAWVGGVEAAASADVLDRVDVLAAVTRQDSVNLVADASVANNQLPRVPGWEIDSRVAVRHGETARLGHTFSYTAGHPWDATNWYWSAPRAIHGVFAVVQPGPRLPELSIDVLNVFDRITEVVPRNPLDPSDPARVVAPMTDFYGFPLAGRTVVVTVRFAPQMMKEDR